MNIHDLAVKQPKKMLQNLAAWLDKAAAYAESKSFDAGVLLGARLAPDQFALVRQVQTACDNAKFMAARLTGQQAPSHPDDETTLEQLRARIASVVAYLDGFDDPAAFDGAAERRVTLRFLPEGAWVRGEDYLREFALPNFYFHVTTAYAILRHNGVGLGKIDYIGGMTLQNA